MADKKDKPYFTFELGEDLGLSFTSKGAIPLFVYPVIMALGFLLSVITYPVFMAMVLFKPLFKNSKRIKVFD